MQVLLAAFMARRSRLGSRRPPVTSPGATTRGRCTSPPMRRRPGTAPWPGPIPRIAQAVAAAVAGDTVLVGPGRYAEEVRTVRPGRPAAPIRVLGRPGAHLVGSRGLARGRLVQVLHDHVTLQSLELSDANILVWVQGARGVRLLGNRLHDAGGECVRLKGHAQANEVAGNVIARCGRVRFDLARGAKNGEAIYIGTAPEQSGGRPDRSNGNRVHHNRIAATAECVDVKEAALRNLVERNRCSGSDDPDGAGLSSRGDHTTFRYNVSTRHAGAGIRLGETRRRRACATTWSATPSPTTPATASRSCAAPRAGSRATPSPATAAGARTRWRSQPGASAPSFLTTPFSRRRSRDLLVSNRAVRTPHGVQPFYPLRG